MFSLSKRTYYSKNILASRVMFGKIPHCGNMHIVGASFCLGLFVCQFGSKCANYPGKS